MGAVLSEGALDPAQVGTVLRYLGVEQRAPDLEFLDQLVAAYICRVPWESAFRIVRRHKIGSPALCPRWPALFWEDACLRGGGGTCFESNYAFYALLLGFGYSCYLTVNNMGSSLQCHSAIIVLLQGQQWLVDVGLPLYAPLPFQNTIASRRQAFYHAYTVTPEGEGRYTITRNRHPQPYCFTLVDRPVSEAEYQAATVRDYSEEEGRFLDRVIVNKVIDGTPWRFSSSEAVDELTCFVDGQAYKQTLGEDVAYELAVRFGMHEAVLRTALALVTRLSRSSAAPPQT